MTGSFAYVHCKPDDTPFYVGKGALRRAKHFGERNPHHKNIVAKYGSKNLSYAAMECSDDATAYLLEQGLIKCLLRSGVKLVNLTAGGDGGRSPSEETRAKLSAAAKKRGVSVACHEARVEAKRGVPLSQAQRDKQRIKMLGRVFSEEHRNNISVSAKKRGMSPQFREAARAAVLGRVQSEEERRMRSEALKKAWDRKGRKEKPAKTERKNPWGVSRPTRAIYVDSVWYPSVKEASLATGVSSSCIVHALKRSGVTHGRKVSEATRDN
jgi:hypothetical protein